MSCERLLRAAALLQAHCRPQGDGWILSLPVTYSDGDIPQMLVTPAGSEWILDDLGAVSGRIYDRGLDWTAAMSKALEQIADANQLLAVDGGLTASCSDDVLAGAIRRFTAALLQADALPLLAPAEREETFSRRVVTFVRELDVPVAPKRRIKLVGRTWTATAVTYRSDAEHERRDWTIVQAASDQQGIEHAHYFASSFRRDGRPAERFLTVVSDSAYRRKADIRNLADVAFVSHMATPTTVRNWLLASDQERRSYSRELPQATLG